MSLESESPPPFPGTVLQIHPPIAPHPAAPLAVAVPKFSGKIRDKLSQRDWVATWFAGFVFAAILITTGVIVRNWYSPALDLVHIPMNEQQDAIEHFKELTGVLGDRTEKMFDLTITKALLPVLTTLIGFILGKEKSSE